MENQQAFQGLVSSLRLVVGNKVGALGLSTPSDPLSSYSAFLVTVTLCARLGLSPSPHDPVRCGLGGLLALGPLLAEAQKDAVCLGSQAVGSNRPEDFLSPSWAHAFSQ